MHSGSGGNALKQNSAVSVYIGIASLVLEGRVIGTDEDDDDAFPKFESTSANQSPFTNDSRVLETPGVSTPACHGVNLRITEKLMSLRQFPGSNKEVVETSMAIPTQSRDDGEYERQPRLHHVASTREFQRNQRLTTLPTSSASSNSLAASVLHDIDVDWNDISILFNGLDSLVNLPGSPKKLSGCNSFRVPLVHHPVPLQPEPSLYIFNNKEKVAGKSLKPKQGPHCDKFLKKIGILRVDPSEVEIDHMCGHTSGYCRRWQFNLKKMLQVLSKGDDACIEVYLGPENNAILLEQWTFKLTDNPSPSTMTIQALCSAIRSQLYFSQVSSWVDLLKKAFVDADVNGKDQAPNLFSPEIMQNPRLKKNLQTMQVDLDILFRIKPFDGASCFNEKPNVHIFPDTIVSDRLALRVSLKSLPRLEKIPTLNTEKANINGFSCDNRIKTSLGTAVPLTTTVAAGSSCHLLHDRTFPSCHETGKHRCKDEDEEDYDAEECVEKRQSPTAKSFAPSQDTQPTFTPPLLAVPVATLSHRERQLLKYKKRLMKRDKQKNKVVQDGDQSSISSLNTSGSEEFDKFQDAAINDTFAPLYGVGRSQSTATTTNNRDSTQNILKTLSIATQTEIFDDDISASSKCNNCGEDLQCWSCDKNQSNFKTQTTSLTQSTKTGSIECTMVSNKADLLLQALQRTADAHPDGSNGLVSRDKTKENMFNSSKSHRGDTATPSVAVNDKSSDCDTTVKDNNNYMLNNNNLIENGDNSGALLEVENDCRLCKRQKTRHNYTTPMSVSSTSSTGSYRRTMSECLVGINLDLEDDETDGTMSYSSFPAHNWDDAEFNSANLTQLTSDDINSNGYLKAYRRAFSEDVINQLPSESCCFESNEDEDCLTIKCNHCKSTKTSMAPPAALKLTPNVTLIQASTVGSMTPLKKLLGYQKIPKINLSSLFDTIQPTHDDSGIVGDTSPTIDSVFAFNSSPASSYPPVMMQVSPKFPRGSNSLLKRRSRHVSDRSSISEYSNISDEDEDILKVVMAEPTEHLKPPPAPLSSSSSSKISSLYKKFVTKTYSAFNKLPLLGTIEESLLRDRFQPKAIVNGFKLLLGASGSFCPTQLTIPAQTFFYEFQGMKHMSTPYVCEFRLARKGYSIPRTGTVQTTLLNPQGTVVRMFFVPYDFRDMPVMSQTFIRQRVLAIDEQVSQKDAEQMSTVEQMKHLRYLVHLKFQTGRSGRLCLHTEIKLLISRRTEFDTAQAHAKNSLESPNDLKTVTITPDHPKFSSRIDKN